MSNDFNIDDDWSIPIDTNKSLIINDIYTTPKLEVGKKYKVEYVVSFPKDAGMMDILPQSATEFTIYDVSCVEVLPKIEKYNELVPKGMSPSYYHIQNKQRKKK